MGTKGGSIAVRLFAFINDQINVNSNTEAFDTPVLIDEAPFIAGAVYQLCFNETNDPRINRDDLHITLKEGSFTRDGKRSAKNILIKVSAVLDTGSEANQLNRGTGPQNDSLQAHITALYSTINEKPRYNETIRMKILPEDIFWMHLLFVYYHVSTTARKTAPFGYSFLPLTKADGSMLKDGVHDLEVYKIMDGMGEENCEAEVSHNRVI